MTTVVHCHKSPYTLYIGRACKEHPQGSKWHNPFHIGVDGDRDEVCDKYEKWFWTQLNLVNAIPELVDQVLGCWCKPDKRCHGDFLAYVANTYQRIRKGEGLS